MLLFGVEAFVVCDHACCGPTRQRDRLKIFRGSVCVPKMVITRESKPAIIVWITKDDRAKCAPIAQRPQALFDQRGANAAALQSWRYRYGSQSEPSDRKSTRLNSSH